MLKVLVLIFLNFSMAWAESPKVFSIPKIQRPFLYEATKDSKTIFLFGTIHVDIDSTELPNWFWNYFNSAESYFFESGMYGGGISNPESWEKVNNQVTKGSLKSFLTPQEYTALDYYFPFLPDKDKYFSEHSISFITHLVASKRRSWGRKDDSVSLDDQLEKAADRSGIKGFHYLDEPEDNSFNCVYQADEGKNLYNLKYYLTHPPAEKPDEYRKKMLDDYRKGIVSKPYEGSAVSVTNDNCIVTGRNKIWLPKILEVSKKSSKVFVVAGVAHINENKPNLIQLLQQKGFKIRRLEK